MTNQIELREQEYEKHAMDRTIGIVVTAFAVFLFLIALYCILKKRN